MQVEDLIIDIEADLSWGEVHLDLGARRSSLRLRFPPRQAGANALSHFFFYSHFV